LTRGSILVEGGSVVTLDAEGRVLEPGWVYTTGDRVLEVGAGDAPLSLRRVAETVLSAEGQAVMPGMINAHTHLFQTLFRGQADDKPLLEWLRECILPAASLLTAEEAEAAAMLGLIENLRGGATSVIDHQYVHVDEGIDDAVCRAADRLGVRLLLARGWADRNYHPPLMETGDEVLARTGALRERWKDHVRIRVELAPLIPWACSDETMRRTIDAAKAWGVGTHIHCAETKEEVAISLEERGVRHVPWLQSLGGLSPDTQLAHSVWLDDEELDMIAASGAVVVHCPVSNMYLASGVARIAEMRAKGIRVALASDGPGSNNRQDMFEVLKTSVLLQKVHRLEAMVMQPEDALEMACRGGAAAFGLPDLLGALEPGRKADLILVDLRSPFVAPVHRVASALVFCCTPRDVRSVIVDGRPLIRDGELLTAEESEVIGRAEVACRNLFARLG
jgi:5-methylthioadenosine/S-adenosylhomocysteine deaminase